MTTCDWDDREDDWDNDDCEEKDEWVLDCGSAECCMNFAPHFRSECYTPEMYEAYVEEVTTGGIQSGTRTADLADAGRADDSHDRT